MSRLRHLAALSVLGSLASMAQVSVELDFDKEFYIADEPMMANVRITNFSGRTLSFGEDSSWLQFSVDRRDGLLVDRRGAPEVRGVFEVPNAKRATRRVNLAPHFSMGKPGLYQVGATVLFSDLAQIVSAPQAEVSIIGATTLWRQEFGVTLPESGELDVRRYSLIRALNGNRFELYVRVARRDGSHVFGVFPVGNMVSFGEPETQIDQANRLHILQQYGARSFRYLVVTPDGELYLRHRYDYSLTRPRLAPDPETWIRVEGGRRVPRSNDLPPSSRILAQEEVLPAREAPLEGSGDGQASGKGPLPGKAE